MISFDGFELGQIIDLLAVLEHFHPDYARNERDENES
jgi:hypothetical protein